MSIDIPGIAKRYLKQILLNNGMYSSHFTKKRTVCRQRRFQEAIQKAVYKKQITLPDVEVILYLWG